PFEHFLSLEDHGNAWAGKHDRGAQGGSLLSVPTISLTWMNLLRNSLLFVGSSHRISDFVVRLGVHDPLEGVAIVSALDRISDGPNVAIFIPRRAHRSTQCVMKLIIPLAIEPSAA